MTGFAAHGDSTGSGLFSNEISSSSYTYKTLLTSTSPSKYLKNWGASSTTRCPFFKRSTWFQIIGSLESRKLSNFYPLYPKWVLTTSLETSLTASFVR